MPQSLSYHPNPFGSVMQGRNWTDVNRNYRYGFNGKEKDFETANDNYDFGARICDSRLGRFLSIDPHNKFTPEFSPYQFAGNSPITCIDFDGLEAIIVITSQYYMKKIKQAVSIGDFEEAERLVWEAIHKTGNSKSARFTPDKNMTGGFIVYFKSNSNILFSVVNSDIYLYPKRPWPKGGYDWETIEMKQHIVSGLINQMNEVSNQIKTNVQEINRCNETILKIASDPSLKPQGTDPKGGLALLSYIKMRPLIKRIAKLEKENIKLKKKQESLKLKIIEFNKEIKEMKDRNEVLSKDETKEKNSGSIPKSEKNTQTLSK